MSNKQLSISSSVRQSDLIQAERPRLIRRSLAALLCYPALLLILLPLLQATSAFAQEATAQNGQLVGDPPTNTPSWSVNLGTTQNSDLATLNRSVGMLDAMMSGYRRLKINAVDKAQFDAYLKVEKYGQLQAATKPSILSADGNVDASQLNNSYREQIGIDRLSDYSRKLIQSILNEVTPSTSGGAGHEYANVFRITKDHRTESNRDSEESIPPFEEEPRESQHFKDNGKAVDISELDNLRGTKFTIETTVDSQGKPVIKDGKPVEEVIDYEHLPIEPIQFVWQSEQAADAFPGTLPAIYGATPHSAAQTLAGNQLGGVIKEELGKRSGRDLDFDGINLAFTNNLGQLSQVLGKAVIDQAMERGGIQLGPNAPLWTGQTSLSQVTGLPSFGFYGTSLDGAPNGQPGLLINMGREVVQQRILPQLPQGALAGNTSDEIFTNVGERTFESALGDLPLGTLDNIAAGDRRSLDIHVGRGVLAQQLNLFLSQVPLNADTATFNQSLGFQLDALSTAPLAYDTSLDIRGTNATQQLAAGQLSPDDYLQKIGAARLQILTSYGTEADKHRADSALNLDERPNLFTELKDLPASPDPLTPSKDALEAGQTALTATESGAASSRAQFILDKFAFASPSRQLLESIRDGSTSSDVRFVLNDTEFKAWLLDTAYMKGVNADQAPKVARFLSADTGVFYEVGTDQVAKGIAKENDQRAALRSYFRTGIMPTLDDNATPVVDLNNLVGQVGLRSRTDFEAIFRSNAPLPVFEMVGRRSLLASFGQNPTDLVNQAVSPIGSAPELKTRLEALQTATTELAAASSGETQQALQQATTVINQLQSSVDTSILAGKSATPQAWTSSLLNLYQAGQTAAGTADQHVEEYRQYALALANLASGDTSQALYTLGDNLRINHPIGQVAATNLIGALNGTLSPNTAIQSFGNSVISQVNGLDTNTSQLIFDLLGTITSQRQTSTADIQAQLRNFATDHAAELAEASMELELQTYGYDLNGAPLKLSDSPSTRETQLAEAMVRLLTQGDGSPTSMKLGSSVIDEAFGIENYQVSPNGFGTFGMLTTDLNGAIGQVMERAQNDQKLWELLTGQDNADLSLNEQGGRMMAAAGTEYILNSLLGGIGGSFNRRMITDPNYEFTMDEGIALLEGVSGQSIDQFVASNNIPIVGDFLTDRNTLRSVLSGQIFDGNSDFWKNQSYLPHIEGLASQAGVPPSLVRGLLDRNLTGNQRETLLGGTAKEYFQSRLTAENINELMGLEGTDFALAGDTLSGSIGILLNDSITDKGGALQSLGAAIGDNYVAANFGFPISWLWDNNIAHTEKIKTGLNVLTQATGLDPEIGALAQTAYSTFFVGDGIKLDTVEGRQNMATLVGTIGSAANVPPEFITLAASVMTGDLETTLVSYAGQSFIDNQLVANGITDMTFGDVYQAFISPLPATESLAYTTAFNEVIGSQDLGAIPSGDLTIEVKNPNTGELIKVSEGLAGLLDAQTSKLRETAQTAARANISYALGDALINQALGGGEAGGVRGITEAMLTGTVDQQITAFSGMLASLSQNEQAGQIFGSLATAQELAGYFSAGSTTATLSSGTIAQMDNWFTSATGIPAPAGSMSSLLNFAKTGDTASFNNLVSTNSLVANFGGFVDQSLGLPSGSTQLAHSMYSTLSNAQTAVDAATSSLYNVSAGADALEVLGAQQTLATAQAQLALTQANLVAVGVTLVFGKQIAAIDSALGLPSGTASMLVTAGITSLMVPGISFAVLASSVFLPALAGMLLASLLSGNGILGIFGGTKKIKRTEILWSYHVSDPALRPEDKEATPPVDAIATCKAEKAELALGCLKPLTELDRGDWPEEAWFVDLLDPGESPQEPNIIAPGMKIALKPDKELPVGIFHANTKQQFRTGSVGAAQTKVRELLGDLLTLNTRLSDQEIDGQPDPEDTSYIPNQIWTHNRQDVESYEGLINTVYGQGEIGSYQEHIDTYRRGVGFDEKISLLVRWLHWQY